MISSTEYAVYTIDIPVIEFGNINEFGTGKCDGLMDCQSVETNASAG